jgi:hypothetical protein
MTMTYKGIKTMFRFSLLFVSAVLSASTVLAETVTVTFSLASSQNGQTVPPGTAIDWAISASLPTSGSAGLAMVCVDLVQASGNPTFIDLPPAAGVPSGMTNFSRPLGVSNPGEGGATTGYIGLQRTPTGQGYKNLVQIGGGQNTVGSTLAAEYDAAQSATVVSGIGQGGTAQFIASGSFQAPGLPGTYTIQLAEAVANVLDSVSPPPVPPAYWQVSSANVDVTGASFSFTVVGMVLGDLNCDGLFNAADIPHFAEAILDSAVYAADHDGNPHPPCQRNHADLNGDTRVDGLDIQYFLDALLPPS